MPIAAFDVLAPTKTYDRLSKKECMVLKKSSNDFIKECLPSYKVDHSYAKYMERQAKTRNEQQTAAFNKERQHQLDLDGKMILDLNQRKAMGDPSTLGFYMIDSGFYSPSTALSPPWTLEPPTVDENNAFDSVSEKKKNVCDGLLKFCDGNQKPLAGRKTCKFCTNHTPMPKRIKA